MYKNHILLFADGDHFNAVACQFRANFIGECQCMRAVSMNTHRISLNGYVYPLLRQNLAFLHHAHDLRNRLLRVQNQRVRLSARGERAILLIRSIRENFARRTQPDLLSSLNQLATG